MGLQLVGQEGDQGRVESAGLCCLVVNGGAGLGAHGLCDSVQIEALIANLL